MQNNCVLSMVLKVEFQLSTFLLYEHIHFKTKMRTIRPILVKIISFLLSRKISGEKNMKTQLHTHASCMIENITHIVIIAIFISKKGLTHYVFHEKKLALLMTCYCNYSTSKSKYGYSVG
jgi:hypothetical protein